MGEDDKVEYPEDTVASALSIAFDDAVEQSEEVEDVRDEPIISEGTDSESAPVDDTEDVEGVQASEEEDTPEDASPSVEEIDVPSSLPPAAREAWKDVPPVVKEAVAKREKDFEAGIMKYSANAKRAEQMDQTLAPFQQFLSMNGSPGETIKGLLQTGSLLQMGSPTQKAQVVAHLISQFGVGIQDLDNLLSGQDVPRGTQQTSEVQQAVQQAVAPYQQMMNEQKQRQNYENQQKQHAVGSEIEQFAAANEFYQDVHMEMADILEMGANRGLNISLPEAYEKACLLNKDVSAIMSARNGAAQIPAKKKASVSISGDPGGPGDAGKGPTKMEDQLNAAWDAVARR